MRLSGITQKLYKINADRQNLPALYNSIGLAIPCKVARQQSLTLFCQTIKITKFGRNKNISSIGC
jgi:hypothetical protein